MSKQVDIDKLVEIKRRYKDRKPVFLRHLWWKKPKFKNDPKWRKPKGIDNKMRLKLKGYPPMVEVGYRSPRLVRGMHPSGFKPVVVSCIKDLDKLDPRIHAIYLDSSIGLKKRMELAKIALEKGFKVINSSGIAISGD
ncbi:MAG: 50S ribosomal protein L32e [Desulfurococcaceae archaeon]